MRVTQIKQQLKNSERVSVFVDGKYSFSLTLNELLEERLKIGTKLDEPALKRLKQRSADGKLRQRALEWLAIRPHSVREFRDYMHRKKVDPEMADQLHGYFIDKKYLDDNRFAEWFVQGRLNKNRSRRQIRSELMNKGIDKQIIDEHLPAQDGDARALRILIPKLRQRPRYREEQALLRYLTGKGFADTDIKEALLSLAEGGQPLSPEMD